MSAAPPDDRTAELVAAFQAAALQLIAATRALLDVAEELVQDPAPLTEVVTNTMQAAGEALRNLRPTGDDAVAGEPSSRVEHIRVT